MRFAYSLAYFIIRPIGALLYPMRYIGRENIPVGAAIVCANHSSMVDPVLVAFALKRKRYPRFMGKAELFKIPVLRTILRWLGVFKVDRSIADVSAVRTSMKLLKSGETIMLFPEGTRIAADDAIAAKNGAIRLASKMSVPILPVHVPRRKPLFRRGTVVIGKPYHIEANSTRDGFQALSDDLMSRINGLSEAGE